MTKQDNIFQRRRYFYVDVFSNPDRDKKMAAEFRKNGITAWTNREYSKALESLVEYDSEKLSFYFQVVCIENIGDGPIIERIKASHQLTMTELNFGDSRGSDTFINALDKFAQVEGVRLEEHSYMPSGPIKVERQDLSQMLGIKALEGLSGYIERLSEDYVYIRYEFYITCDWKYGVLAEIPISSCPALQRDESTASCTDKTSLRQMEDDALLRPYQTEQKNNILKAWQSARRVMLQMPTGTGKTRLFVSLIRDIKQQQPNARILIVAHRAELIEQTSLSLTLHYRLRHGILGKKNSFEDSSILVASIQMLSRKISKEAKNAKDTKEIKDAKETKDATVSLQPFDYIIIDEAHHSLAPSYKKLIEAYPKTRVLGVTATPYRLKKASFTELYDTLVESVPMRQFLTEGYLANYRMYTVSDRMVAMSKINRLTKFGADGDYKAKDLKEILDTDDETARLYDCYQQYAQGKKGIVYAVSRDHAAHIAALFSSKGVNAAAIDCDTPREERQRLIEAFKAEDGTLQVLVNVELFTEGFDCPSIDFVLLARPTRSLTLYLQQVGRALRPSPNGKDVTILDCAGLYNRFGLPERKRDWQTHFKGEKPKREDYTKLPLGSPSVYGLMKEVDCPRKEIVYSDDTACIYTLDHDKYGLCDKAGRVIFQARYDKITPTPYGWYIGERQEARQDIAWQEAKRQKGTRQEGMKKVQDALSPKDAKIHSFLTITEEAEGIYSAKWSKEYSREVYTFRFDSNLRLIPNKTVKVEDVLIYLHGEVKEGHQEQMAGTGINPMLKTEMPFCITSLSLDAPMYSKWICQENGVTRLQGINCADSIIKKGMISKVMDTECVEGKTYTATKAGWWITPDGTFYWPVHAQFPLHYTEDTKGITLYDGHFTPLLHGDSIEVHKDHCVVYSESHPPLSIGYMDYLRFGLPRQAMAFATAGCW